MLLMALSSENWGGMGLALGDEEAELELGGGAEADEDEVVAAMIRRLARTSVEHWACRLRLE